MRFPFNFLLFFFLHHPSSIFAFFNPFSNSQFPLNDVVTPATENLTSTTDSVMAEHDGHRAVAYFVNWVGQSLTPCLTERDHD